MGYNILESMLTQFDRVNRIMEHIAAFGLPEVAHNELSSALPVIQLDLLHQALIGNEFLGVHQEVGNLRVLVFEVFKVGLANIFSFEIQVREDQFVANLDIITTSSSFLIVNNQLTFFV